MRNKFIEQLFAVVIRGGITVFHSKACLIGAALTAIIPASASAEEMVRAYVLLEAKPGQLQNALQSVNGLGNCLALTHSFMGDEILAHIHCDGPKYLNTAITEDIPKNEAVARVTVLAVLKGP
jgi:hypothetical protein